MMKLLFAAIALFVASAYGGVPTVVYNTNITANTITGIDVVFLDGPAWVTQIEQSWGTHEFFVFGDKALRTISAGRNQSSFFAEPDLDPLSYPLLNLHTMFYTDNNTGHLTKLTVGVSDFNAYDPTRFNGVVGPYLPLFYATRDLNVTGTTTSTQNLQKNDNVNKGNPNFSGFLLYALRCDEWSISNTVIAYYAGYQIVNNTVNFVLVRTFLALDFSMTAPQFTFDPVADVFTLYSNMYTAYNEAFKPWIHLLVAANGHNVTIVVDPNSQAIYSVDLTTGSINSMSLVSTTTVNNVNIIYDIVSTAYDFRTSQLVVGFAATGMQPGFMLIFNLAGATTGSYVIPDPMEPLYLPGNYSNPKALALDDTAIYIGLNGVGEALKYNLTTKSYSYQRLPEFLHRSWSAIARRDHVYFSTYEQNSKVFRINKDDFCSAPCPYFGYCTQGQCTCSAGFEFSHDKSQCLYSAGEREIIYHKEYEKAHGGEIALGILFALSFVAAAAGWFMWYKSRHGAYQSV